ncbi:MAG TPA: hypothetical protein VFZ16_05010 [Hyphomicrobiaceae bacterium]|nr:hypothetical protein [Hyphomicrobiaceae bacterium]
MAIELAAPDVDVGAFLKSKGEDGYAVIERRATDLQPGLIEQDIVVVRGRGRGLARKADAPRELGDDAPAFIADDLDAVPPWVGDTGHELQLFPLALEACRAQTLEE